MTSEYVLATGQAAVPRLEVLEKVYGPSTNMLFEQAGLKPGMRVVEMGCGAGFTTCSLARAVGPAGRVVAVDISGEQLAVARSNAERAGLSNIEFVEASAIRTGVASAQAEFVYCRLLFSHIRVVGDVLAEFRRLLKPGGFLACEELNAAAAYSIPENRTFTRLGELAIELAAKAGTDFSVGSKLPQFIRSAGLEICSIRTVQPAYFRGAEKRFWELSFREVSPAMIKTGVLDATEREELLHALEAVGQDDNVMVAQPAMIQILSRRHSGD